jgi:hypothetical protein
VMMELTDLLEEELCVSCVIAVQAVLSLTAARAHARVPTCSLWQHNSLDNSRTSEEVCSITEFSLYRVRHPCGGCLRRSRVVYRAASFCASESVEDRGASFARSPRVSRGRFRARGQCFTASWEPTHTAVCSTASASRRVSSATAMSSGRSWKSSAATGIAMSLQRCCRRQAVRCSNNVGAVPL